MQEISLNDLPRYSPWITRLLGLEIFERQIRDLAKIEREYNRDKYGRLLDYYKGKRDAMAEEVKCWEMQSEKKEICISRGGKLFLVTPEEDQSIQDALLLEALGVPLQNASTVIELGCGYGYNLMVLNRKWPDLNFLGGEYSTNAVELSTILFGQVPNISIKQFNFYNSEWSIFECLRQPVIVFTRHAIEQLPKAKAVFSTLAKYRDKITDVIHLEPVYEMTDDTLLGVLRRSYTHLNDYNTDLLATIKEIGGNTKQMDYDIYGNNPLNPTSLVHWQFPPMVDVGL